MTTCGKSHGKEEESLEATSENRHIGCGRNVLGQTVPSTGRSNREGLITYSFAFDKKSKPTQKLKHTNSILEYFEYFCQM